MQLSIYFFTAPIVAQRVLGHFQTETATPPALEALPGANKILFSSNTSIASGVHGMFAPSLTQLQPLATRAFAS